MTAIVPSGGAARRLSPEEMLGIEATHVAGLETQACIATPVLLHPEAADAFLRLRGDALRAGFDLRAASGFRDFARQLRIWNGKARGERELLDADERPLVAAELDPEALMRAILRWSALPGLSRHHWGCDVDVVDVAAFPPGTAPRLLLRECAGDGCQAPLHAWLGERMAYGRAYDFFRPYVGVDCDVAQEPWHLSYAPLSAACQAALDPHAMRRVLDGVHLELREQVYAALPRILERYARVPAALYPEPWRSVLEHADKS